MKALTLEQARLFQAEAMKDKRGLVLVFALITGMRPEEYLGLKWSDIDLDQGTATIRRTLVPLKDGGWKFGEPKTSRSRRTVSFPIRIANCLRNHRCEQNEARLKAGTDFENNDLVFSTSAGRPHSLRNLTQRHFQPILKVSGTAEN